MARLLRDDAKPGNGGAPHQTASASVARITSHRGVPVSDNLNSLRTGSRGPRLLETFLLREKIQHFHDEPVPGRIDRARCSDAHGHFALTDSLAGLSRTKIPTKVEGRTEQFTRISAVHHDGR